MQTKLVQNFKSFKIAPKAGRAPSGLQNYGPSSHAQHIFTATFLSKWKKLPVFKVSKQGITHKVPLIYPKKYVSFQLKKEKTMHSIYVKYI